MENGIGITLVGLLAKDEPLYKVSFKSVNEDRNRSNLKIIMLTHCCHKYKQKVILKKERKKKYKQKVHYELPNEFPHINVSKMFDVC